jgi:hypothetical protein
LLITVSLLSYKVIHQKNACEQTEGMWLYRTKWGCNTV